VCNLGVDEEINLKSNQNNKINIIKSNYILQLSMNIDNHMIGASKSFYSLKKCLLLLENLCSLLTISDKKTAIKLKIVLINKITKISKTKYVMIDVDDARKRLEEIKSKVVENKNVVKFDKNRYRIIIDNCISHSVDKRGFSIDAPDSMDKIIIKLKNMMSTIIKEESDSFVVYLNDKNISTHRVMVQKVKNIDGIVHYITKSFSIIFPNVSSLEVVSLIINKIGGLKNE